jgi:8-oxo-dGTP pyrophosphatase MutT (NUDIX family)
MCLMLKRGLVRWELPAGVAKDGESMEEAAIRETFEETGIRVEVDDAIAYCWHHSRQLAKGWLGIFFKGRIAGDPPPFRIIKSTAVGVRNVNFANNSELFLSVDIDRCDLERAVAPFESLGSRLAAHENVLGSGFVEWGRIPRGRMHPLHRKLLELLATRGRLDTLLTSDADTDVLAYDRNALLYLQQAALA